MLRSEEQFDIYDERMNPIGTASRSETHAKGYWHRTFHCWVWDESEEEAGLLFQQRHPGKDTFPGLLDISCAGHLLSGETVEDGLRELEEELGLTVPFEELIPCGVFAEEDFIGPGMIDREFCHVHLLRSWKPLSLFRLQSDEVTALYRLSVRQVSDLAAGLPVEWEMEGVIRNVDGTLSPHRRVAVSADFVPHPREYFELVLAAVRRLHAGPSFNGEGCKIT